MKKDGKQDRWVWLPGAVLIGLLLSGADAWAAESAGNWRPVYDLVMRWVNFLILVFLLVKFGRVPIKNFLRSRKDEIAREIESLEQEKTKVLFEVDQNLKAIEDSQDRFVARKERIMRQGEKRKQEIIEAGQREGEIVIESAKHKIQSKILKAEDRVRNEIIDSAFALALERIPQLVNASDHERMLENFYSEITPK
jgi:F-type H+-transporting ATPase subunit b